MGIICSFIISKKHKEHDKWHLLVIGAWWQILLENWVGVAPNKNNKNDRLHYMEKFRDPYITRRRKVGWDLYALLDIKKGDYEKTKSFHVQNFSFFGAPLGLIFTIEKDLGWMSWLDYGMFLQNICIAARAYGLHTCAQASWSGVHEDISPLLKISENHLIHCGMSIGMEDKQAEVNKLRTDRADLDDFVTFSPDSALFPGHFEANFSGRNRFLNGFLKHELAPVKLKPSK